MDLVWLVPGGVHESGREAVIPALLWMMRRVSKRHRLLVIALHQYPDPRVYELEGCQVVNLGTQRARWGPLRIRDRVRRIEEAVHEAGMKPDCIHGFWLGESGMLAGWMGRRWKIPVIVSLGGGELARLKEIGFGGQLSLRNRWRIRMTLKRATLATAGSAMAWNALCRWWPGAEWVPWGVDTSLFEADPSRPERSVEWKLVHVADINPVKDQVTLLRVIRRLLDRGERIRLDWIGKDTLEGRLQAKAEELGVASHICFHGFQPTDRVAEHLKDAHLFIQTSRYESQGIAVLEAAAAGIPTVGTRVGILAELAPEAGVAVPVGDDEGLTHAICGLLNDSTRREAMGRAAQAWAKAHDVDWTVTRFEAFYHKACSMHLSLQEGPES